MSTLVKRQSYAAFALPHLGWLIAGPLAIAAGGVLEIVQPRFMARIVDQAIQGVGLTDDQRLDIIKQTGLWMVLLALLAIAAGVMGVYCISQGTFRFGCAMRLGLYHKVQGYSFANIDRFSSASLVTRLTNDITNVQNTTIQTLRMATFTAAMLTGALINAIAISARLAAVTAFAVPVIAIVVAVIVFKGFPLFDAMQKRIDALVARVQESVTNIRVVKSFVREDRERRLFHKTADDLCDVAVRASGLMVTVMPLMQLVMNLTTIAVIWLGADMVTEGALGIGDLMSYSTYILHILMSLMMMSMAVMMFSRARASSRRIREVLDEQPTVVEKPDAVDTPITCGEVVFDHVSFRYDPASPDKVLDDIDLTIPAGAFVAIVGATGAAKTTLVNLIPRLYDATEGRVLVDGVDVREYKLDTLRGGIGMVPQQSTLFTGTIANNLRWGRPDATDEELEQAARGAQAHDFVTSLPDGYATMLAQGGVNLSGGQKQRLCIARAMVKKPAVLILDDATSAVDSDTESRIREALATQMKGTTVLLIAQRISSVRQADRIVVLDAGRIAGYGTHEDLLECNEIYRDIVESQQKGVGAV